MAPLLSQIHVWLIQPEIWRFVGFVSAAVGLLCYALSPSFNSLFGEWNLLKTFLYGVLSFIICAAVLFAKVWQPSSSLRLEAHVAFLVLTITSFYSFFFDKAANGKPDAYSLVSCAAFAVMSLSMSRQTHCGFEVDLLYFFLGALIAQLMKIKWLLGIAGAGFSYCLIILRSCIDAPPEANVYLGLQDQPRVVIQVSSLQLPSNANSDSALVDTQQEGSTQDHTITQVDPHSQQTNTNFAHIKPQLFASIKALKKKNRKLIRLIYNQTLREPSLPDHNLLIDALPLEIINNLNEVMMVAVAAGFEKECCHEYNSCRREFLGQCLSSLGLQDFNSENYDVDDRISNWIKAFENAVRILFPNERRLCDLVFFGFSSAGDLSFVQICEELTIHLLNFANTFAGEIHSPKIFLSMVEVFKTLLDMIPKLESLFPDQFGASLKNEAITARKRAGEAIRGTFMDMENLIHYDTTIANVPGGIFRITCDVMDWLIKVMKSRKIIDMVFKEYPMAADNQGTTLSLDVGMAWITELLERHLEAKSKNYTEPALGYVSMMNNAMYMEKRVIRLPWLASIFHDDWMQKHTEKFQQNLEDYQRSSWNQVLGLLKQDIDDESMEHDVAAKSIKQKLNLFNIHFEEICSMQSKWFASDDIRKEIITSLENMLLPAYGNFIGRFQDVHGKHAYEYIQYGMFDIKARLNHLFVGAKRMNR